MDLPVGPARAASHRYGRFGNSRIAHRRMAGASPTHLHTCAVPASKLQSVLERTSMNRQAVLSASKAFNCAGCALRFPLLCDQGILQPACRSLRPHVSRWPPTNWLRFCKNSMALHFTSRRV
jgi:hypothetical protein